jgi:SAM-dependent methyltransferase
MHAKKSTEQGEDNSYNNQKFAQLYDIIIKGNNATEFELPFWGACAKEWGGPILEMGCGTGRLLLPLAKLGYNITGIDLSNSMINELKQKIVNNPEEYPQEVLQRITFIQGNMVDASASGKFSLIIFAVSQFLHLKTDEERLKCLNNCRQLLAEEGVLVLSNSKFKVQTAGTPEPVQTEDRFGHRIEFYINENEYEWRDGAYVDTLYFKYEATGEIEKYFWTAYPIDDDHMKDLTKKSNLRLIQPPQHIITQMEEPHMKDRAWFYFCGK